MHAPYGTLFGRVSRLPGSITSQQGFIACLRAPRVFVPYAGYGVSTRHPRGTSFIAGDPERVEQRRLRGGHCAFKGRFPELPPSRSGYGR